MRSFFYTVLLTALWVVNLFNGTGLDSVYHVTNRVKSLVILATVLLLLWRARRDLRIVVKSHDFYLFGGLAVALLLSSYLNGRGDLALSYLWVYCLVYLLAQLPIDDRTMQWTGWAYGALGLAILYIFDYGTTLKGWNTNSIAMIGMHSYLIFLVPYFKTNRVRDKLLVAAVTVLYISLLSPTGSRSGMLFALIAALFALNLLPRKLFYSKASIVIMLLLPLMIAVLVSLISLTPVMDGLNSWSYEHFSKPIFNGRDGLWINGFEILFNYPLLGAGSPALANWHNSAITCLTAYGCVGYVLWICGFYHIIDKARAKLTDSIVIGCVISFSVLYVQQSVELGFISSNPTLLGYVLLGLLMGRKKLLEQPQGAVERGCPSWDVN